MDEEILLNTVIFLILITIIIGIPGLISKANRFGLTIMILVLWGIAILIIYLYNFKNSEEVCTEGIYSPCNTYEWCQTKMDKKDCKTFCEKNYESGDHTDYCYDYYCKKLNDKPFSEWDDENCKNDYCERICETTNCLFTECNTWYCQKNPEKCGYPEYITKCSNQDDIDCKPDTYLSRVMRIRSALDPKYYLALNNNTSVPSAGETFSGEKVNMDIINFGAVPADNRAYWILRSVPNQTDYKYVFQPYTEIYRRYSINADNPKILTLDAYLNGVGNTSLNSCFLENVGKGFFKIYMGGGLLTYKNENIYLNYNPTPFDPANVFYFDRVPSLDSSIEGIEQPYSPNTLMGSSLLRTIYGKRTYNNNLCSNNSYLGYQDPNRPVYLPDSSSSSGMKWSFGYNSADIGRIDWNLNVCSLVLNYNNANYAMRFNTVSTKYIEFVKNPDLSNRDNYLVAVEFSTWRKAFRLLIKDGNSYKYLIPSNNSSTPCDTIARMDFSTSYGSSLWFNV